NANATARSTAMTMPITASTNSTTNRKVIRRCWRWRSKKFIGTTLCWQRPTSGGAAGSERSPRGPALLRGVDLKQRCRRETKRARDQAGREDLAPVVVRHDGVVVRLTRERDPVLG